MKKHIIPIFAILIILSVVFIYSCHKSGTSGCPTGGGKGGSITLNIIPEHSNYFVDSCMVYIKYGTQDAPASGIYDDSMKVSLSDTTPVASFKGLTEGNYYVEGIGYHALLSENVKGGLPCTLCAQQTYTVYLPTYPY